MKRVITISYVVDGPAANAIGRYDGEPNIRRLVYQGLYGLFGFGESLEVSDVHVVNERFDNCPTRDAIMATRDAPRGKSVVP